MCVYFTSHQSFWLKTLKAGFLYVLKFLNQVIKDCHLSEMLSWFIMSPTSVNAFLTCSHWPGFYLYFLKGTCYWEDYFWICSLHDLARRKRTETSVLISNHIININVLKWIITHDLITTELKWQKNNYAYIIKLKII